MFPTIERVNVNPVDGVLGVEEVPQTSLERFAWRMDKWVEAHPRTGVFRHHGWWLLHNLVAHVAIGLVPAPLFFAFHDWTSKRLNNPTGV